MPLPDLGKGSAVTRVPAPAALTTPAVCSAWPSPGPELSGALPAAGSPGPFCGGCGHVLHNLSSAPQGLCLWPVRSLSFPTGVTGGPPPPPESVSQSHETTRGNESRPRVVLGVVEGPGFYGKR